MAVNTEELNIKIKINNRQAKKSVDGLLKSLGELSTSVEGLETTVKKGNKSNQSYANSFSKVGASIIEVNQAFELASSIYSQVSQKVGAVVNAFTEFETALVGVQKTSNLSDQEIEKFGDNISDLSKSIPVASKRLLAFSQTAGQLGVTGQENLENFAETMAKVEVATDLAGDTAATQFTRILTVTGEGIDKIDEFSSVMVALGNNFAATESEIARMTNEVARSVGQFGASAEEAAALGTAMRAVGIRAELGGSAIGRLLRTMNTLIREGGPGLTELARISGVTAKEFEEAFGRNATDALLTFLEGLSKSGSNADAVLANLGLRGDEINKVIPPLAKNFELFADALGIARSEMENSNALNQEAAKAFATTGSQIQLFYNAVNNLGVAIGGTLAPFLNTLLSVLSSLANGVAFVVEELREVLVVFGAAGLLRAIPLVIAGFTKLKTVMAGTLVGVYLKQFASLSIAMKAVGASSTVMTGILTANFATIRAGVSALTASFAALARALLLNPFTYIVIGATALIKSLSDLQSNFNFLTDLYEVFVPATDEVRKSVKELESEVSFLEKAFFLLQKIIVSSIGGTVGLIGRFASAFSDLPIIGQYFDGLSVRAENFMNKMKNVYDEIGKARDEIKPPDEEETSLTKGIQIIGANASKDYKNIKELIKNLNDQTKEIRNELRISKFIEDSDDKELSRLRILNTLKAEELETIRKQIIEYKTDIKLKQQAFDALINLRQATQEYFRVQERSFITKRINILKKEVEELNESLKGSREIITGFNDNNFEKIAKSFRKKREDLVKDQIEASKKEEELINKIENSIKNRTPKETVSKLQEELKSLRNKRIKLFVEFDVNEELFDLAVFSEKLNMANEFVSAAASGADAMVTKTVDAIGSLYGPIGQLVAGIVNTVRQGYKAMYDLSKGFIDIMINLPQMLGEGIMGLVDGIFDALIAAFSDPDRIARMLVGLGTGIINAITSAVRKLPQLLMKVLSVKFWADVMEAAFLALRDALVGLFESVLDFFTGNFGDVVAQSFIDGVKIAGESLTGFASKVFEVVTDTTAGLMGSDENDTQKSAKNAGRAMAESFVEWLVRFWHFFVDAGEAIWLAFRDGLVGLGDFLVDAAKEFWEFLKTIPKALWDSIVYFIEKFPGQLFEGLADFGMQLWGLFKAAFDNIGSFFAKAFSAIFGNAWEAFKKAFIGITTFFSNIFGDLWDGFKDGISNLFSFPESKGTVEGWMGVDLPVLKFAEGGVVPGIAPVRGDSPKNDNQLSMLSPGEWVIPRSITQDKEKATQLQQVISGDVPQFFMGAIRKAGEVTGVSKAISDVGEATGVNDILEGAEQAIKGLSTELKAVYDWVTKYIGSVDIGSFALDPIGSVMGMIEDGISKYVKPRAEGMMESLAKKSFHSGGFVGNNGMANLQGGEFVMRKSAVNNIGLQNLMGMNSGSSMAGSNQEFNIDITLNTTEKVDESFLTNRLMPEFKQQLKDASLRGDFVISQKGIR